MNDAAATLNIHTDYIVEAAGHTDSTGADACNMSLSRVRAASVAMYLRDKGIDSSRLQVKDCGNAQPIADNKSQEGRAMNRRMVLRILNQD